MTSIRDFNRKGLDASLNDVMDALANSEFGGISVKSGHRSKVGNLLAGGAKKSQHLSGKALDLDISGLSNRQKAALLGIAVAHGVKGVGIYPSGRSLHIDTRPTPTTWGPSKAGQYKGVDPSDQPAWAQPALKSMFSSSFPPAPPGPTTPETGPGMYGAMSAADLAQRYSQAGNRRAYEQGFRPAPVATPQQDFSPQFGPPMSAMQRPQQGPPMSAMQSPTISNMLSGMDSPVYGPGQVAPAAAPQAAPPQARVGPAPSAAPATAPARTPSPDMRYGGPQTNVVANTPMQSINMANASLLGSVLGGATLTPGMVGVSMKKAAAPASVTPTPTPRPDYTAPTAQTPAPAPATVAPAAPAAVSAYPEEGRFSMKKGLTPADQVQMGLTPAPAFTKPPTEVATPKVAKVAAVQPVREQVVKTKTVTPHPAIAPGTPLPEKPGGFIANLENLVGPYAGPLAKFALTSALGPVGALATLPFSKTLQNLAGPVPNPPSRNIGTGSTAISSVLSGQAQAGDTAYSASMPGYSVRDLGNGMVEKTNQFGHVSYDKVDKGGGIFSSKPGGLYSSNPAGVLSGFGLGGVPSSLGGMLSARNLGSFAGGLIGGMPGAVVGGLLGNMISNKTGTAPAASGGGLFGGFGGGFGFGGGGGTSASSGDKRGGGTSSGGRGSMSAGSGGMSKSTRY